MFKKAFAILGSLAVIGVGVSFAQSAGPARKQIESQKRASVRAEFQNRFVDENGDGINDLFRDNDGDGIPNCQDPDWAPPQDGTGYHGGNGNGGGSGPRGYLGNRAGSFGAGQGLNKGAFRRAGGGFCGRPCDGTGPKGTARRGRAR
jgi:hypothetical protein